MNQPTVRDRSTPSKISSRPWPSRSIDTFPCPVHRPMADASAVSSTSLTDVRNLAGTSRSSVAVSAAVSATDTVPIEPAMFGPSPSTGSGADAGSADQ